MASLYTLDDLELQEKRVVLRLDLNLPFQGHEILDTTRMDRILPTLQRLQSQDAIIIILAHRGRPKGQVKSSLSLEPLQAVIQNRLTEGHVFFSPETLGHVPQKLIRDAKPRDIILLENVRFHPGEEKGDLVFARALAQLGDVYVNEAFSVSHRSHSSITGIPKFRPSCAGPALAQEVSVLNGLHDQLRASTVAILSGSKVSTKLGLLNTFAATFDYIILGGGLANTFLYAESNSMGASLLEKGMFADIQKIHQIALKSGCKIILPQDAVVAPEIKTTTATKIVPITEIPADEMVLDIGPKTQEAIFTILETAQTVVWNGPLGVFEVPPFDNGTSAVAQCVAQQTKSRGLLSVAGGGETVAALKNAGAAQDFSYISTAGGAFLEFLEGKSLPGIQALEKSE